MKDGALLDKLQEYRNLIVVFTIGILIGTTFYFKEINPNILYSICLIVFLIFLLCKNKKVFVLICAILFGYFYINFHIKHIHVNLDHFLGQKNIYIGEILSSSGNDSQFHKKYFLRLEKIIDFNKNNETILKNKCNIQILGSHYEEYETGDIVQITGTLKTPKSAILPGLFDEKKYLQTKGINYILMSEQGSLVYLDSPEYNSFVKFIVKLRENLISTNEEFIKGDSLALINGIIFGSKASHLPEDLKDKIQRLGLSHITSASGFNVSVLTFGIFCLFHLFKIKNLTPTIISIIFAFLYTAVADFSSSIIRAFILIVFILIGNLFNKKLKVLPGISLIILVFFLFYPLSILDIGLQLSIFAFLGLALFLNEISDLKSNWFLSLFFQSLFAQIMVLPLIVFYFHNIQLLGLISNIIAIPLASAILITGILNLIFANIPNINLISIFLCKIIELFSNLFLSWANFLDKIPIKEIFLPNIDFYTLILIYVFIFSILCSVFIVSFRKNIKYVLCVLALLFFTNYILTDTSKYLKIFVLPKYNEEAILVIYPKEKPVYFSTRLDESDKRRVLEFLRLNNILPGFIFNDLNINDTSNKITIQHKNFVFEILKHFSRSISSDATFLKLPILMKKDPLLSNIFSTLPENIIVNDYKRLSKKSNENINWLKSQKTKVYCLSESGTIAIISNGKGYKISLNNE